MRSKKSLPMQTNTLRVIGIDPGYERIGISVVEKTHTGEILLFSECVVTNRKDPHHKRLNTLGIAVTEAIHTYKPTRFAIEKLYFNTNQKTALQVAEARGVLLYIASQENLDVFEYSPLQVKTAVTGYGRADKKQMMAMVSRLISIDKKIQFDDEFDAIAIALTCVASEKLAISARYPHTSPSPLAKSVGFDTNRKSKKNPTGLHGLQD